MSTNRHITLCHSPQSRSAAFKLMPELPVIKAYRPGQCASIGGACEGEGCGTDGCAKQLRLRKLRT